MAGTFPVTAPRKSGRSMPERQTARQVARRFVAVFAVVVAAILAVFCLAPRLAFAVTGAHSPPGAAVPPTSAGSLPGLRVPPARPAPPDVDRSNGTTASGPVQAQPAHMPFYVATKGQVTIYVLGTLHVGYADDYPASQPFLTARDKACAPR
ncbi:MAG: uncharacterized protein QOG58_1507 [Caballeronia sp.]|nr:uncharacterized protein [Caballeronia sp.]